MERVELKEGVEEFLVIRDEAGEFLYIGRALFYRPLIDKLKKHPEIRDILLGNGSVLV